MATKIILTHEVTGLGAPGDIVEVKDGYARNYLFPRGLATAWTKGAAKQVEAIRRARKSREIATLDDAKAVKDRLQAAPVVVPAKAGASGRLFGAVTTADIAEAVAAAGGPKLDRRKIEIAQAIKSLGDHTVQVRLHEDVTAQIDVRVVPQA
ncbi:50S ribosomal protein L9 [Actinotalea fermentans]|uniref:Large ribosomal subunit protein bL9 n=1 Tax=Actinotalea fermentans TaxID=43671 RepID=A0A511Z275_9CELL|nr:50S ribosomal protein L9 [Actinotalea fermentans]KGM14977.1 50S ribosomal protein L9 [Actinotalea fermentans ATCC 43279 = JCM 9966 = DSM 3133]GEN81552.1 50S ribosomal protein L9 [Actinotalea fermentans]